jgi:hypothetical protein
MKTYRNILIASLLMATSWVAMAQDDDLTNPQNVDPKVRQKVELARIAFLSDRLGLTPDQAEKFWPVYREFIQKRQGMTQQFREAQKNMDPNDPDPKKQQDLVNFGLQLKQKELDLEKDYSGRIMKVITAQQLLSLRKAEQDFRQLILNQLQQRRTLQERKENFRDKNQRLRQNRK